MLNFDDFTEKMYVRFIKRPNFRLHSKTVKNNNSDGSHK